MGDKGKSFRSFVDFIVFIVYAAVVNAVVATAAVVIFVDFRDNFKVLFLLWILISCVKNGNVVSESAIACRTVKCY